MLRRIMISAAVAIAVAAATVATQAAAASHRPLSFRNARYCEVLGARSTPDGVTVTVWNTIGLSDCPAAKWNAINPSALAMKLGQSFVFLNGPRYFLMDRATGRIGRIRRIAALRMRKVATIHFPSLAAAVHAPYEERTIGRSNTWIWNRGRTVFLLVSPSGARYVMQSYAQIVDHHLTLAQLPSLGHRLKLPAHWHYVVRKLRHRLVLAARGSAIIVQDDLQDTYQRLPARA